ncbi:methyl-accepting chemotaxis protein [Pseudomonas citronellolis]|uniref:Methyl-accepting chemotaxis protein n=1 Tax=Pseudomonas citronellolis TaxID=53408 RepID=A0AAW6P720_9PSED|nr:methyl-accepting chemotaxis protein [Pseudomonas citronellolis]MDF3842987.1 methyl-accepting chemotaxis protein [Pseudomonas citronellolis]
MHWIARLSIAAKLQLAPGLLVLLLLLGALAAHFGIAQQQALLDDIHDLRLGQYQRAFVGVSYAQLLIRETYADVQRLLDAGQPSAQDLQQARDDLLGQADDLLAHIRKSAAEPRLGSDEQELYKELATEAANLKQSIVDLFDAAKDDPHALATGISATRSQFNYVDGLYAKLVDKQRDLTESAFLSAQRKAQWISRILLGLTVFSVLLAVCVSLFIGRQIRNAIGRIREGALSLRDGNLTQRVALIGKDEITQTAAAFNALIDNFQEAVRQVIEGSGRLAGSAQQLNRSTQSIVDSSNQQAESAASVSTTVEQMNQSIQSLAQNAQLVRESAARSLTDTEAGAAALERLQEALQRLEQATGSITGSVNEFVRRTTSISDMTGQVKAIAAQTNLLALNAAIEAARAGDQGRGFAVVAGEVRQLAEMSSDAANRIDEVTLALGQQSTDVERSLAAGASALGSSGEQLELLKALFASTRLSVDDVFQGMEGIAGAVQEQSLGSQDIAQRIEHIASMADASTDICRTTFSASEELRVLADTLQASAARFSV